MHWRERISLKTYLIVGTGLIAVFALALYGMGQPLLCACGYVKLWHGVVQSSENSQHIADWYTFSHIIHGFGFYALLWLGGRRWPMGLRLVLALLMETSWEVFENTDFIINRYRESTIALDYFGDSIINSVGDVLASALGFLLAYRLSAWTIIALVITFEAFVGYWIRDNLIFNIIMLVYPFEAIKTWQVGG